ncbi:MAG: 2-C-methyl-D-erythritol 4-phosphate cytidylyltransferase [Vicinamibacterales bacterium]
MSVAVIIAAGGRGVRLGADVPKQFLQVAGVSLLARSLAAFAGVARVGEVVVVVPAEYVDTVATDLAAAGGHRVTVVAGGLQRQQSVAHGVRALSADVTLVLVHDAARPFVSADLIERTIEAAEQDGAAIAAIAATDTVKRARFDARGALIATTIPREEVFMAQTPQGFRRAVIEAAVQLGEAGATATDEAALAELAGYPVRLVAGEAANIKITTSEDLHLAEFLARTRTQALPSRDTEAREDVPVADRRGSDTMRVGTGYDSHRLVEHRPLILGGVRIPFDKGLFGHSDADVVAHAVTDAILGAAALGDIGRWFPDTDPEWKDADSLRLLAAATARVSEAGWRIVNVDVTVLAERPKLLPFAERIRRNLACALSVDVEQVGVKAKTNEGLDAVGRGEAIVAHAVALLASRS